jgi:hypothetical protein
MQQNLKYEILRRYYQIIFEWFGIMLQGEEQFWKAKAMDAIHEQFYQYEIRFEEILNQIARWKRFI